MKILQAYRFELQPSAKQQRSLARFAGCRRFVYNKALELQNDRRAKGLCRLGFAALCKELTGWKKEVETTFLAVAPAQPLQQALMDLDRAHENFFAGRAQTPRFKRKGKGDSFRYPEPRQIKLDENSGRIFLPKLHWIRYRKSRKISGAIRQVTVSTKCGKWYVSIQTEREIDAPNHPSNTAVGIDVGVARFATLSDGTVIRAENYFRKTEKTLARQQRRLSRQKKFGQNWIRQNRKIQRLHRRIADSRRDFLHKTSTTISKTHALVIIEDLNVKGMTGSASGTRENPGTRVKAKSGLNKSILDQGWSEFRRQLEYKTAWSGGRLIAVSPQHTSVMCSTCSYVSSENRKTQERFECRSCGYTENADLNAARNILSAGRAAYACGGEPMGFSMKQEPSVSAIQVA